MSEFGMQEHTIGNRTYYTFTSTMGDKPLIVEIGKYCEQANGSCVVRCGDTAVMVNATLAAAPRDGIDFSRSALTLKKKCTPLAKYPAVLKREKADRATRLFWFHVLSTDLCVRFSRRDFLTT